MDCCSKYPDYRHHLIGGGVIGSGEGGPINGSYYSHAHPSIRYQHSMYRLNAPGPGGFNGIGPPAATAPSLYPNYERYGSFSNLPSYVYNGNGFSYGNLSGRDVTGYYGQYEGLSRGGGGFSYHNYRSLHDSGVHGPRGAGYHIYSHPAVGREQYSSFGGFHSHSGPNHHHHHHHHQHHHPHQSHFPHYNASKDSFMSQISSDIGSGSGSSEGRGCGSVNDGNSFNSEISAPPLTNRSSSSCADDVIGGALGHIPYSTSGTAYQSNDSVSDSGSGSQQQQQQQQQQQHQQQHAQSTSPHANNQISTGYPYGLKESKQRKSTREKDKCFGRVSSSSRRAECATPLNISPNFEHADTPFTPHPPNINHSPSNIPPRLQNDYIPSNGNLSPFPNSPGSWTQQCSPRPMRKRLYSPRPQPSPKTPLTPNKNRILECDFIPCKKSRKKIKTEQSDDSYEFREEIKNITPLPGFQQAFGSTEIGRFSETFLNTPESPYEHVYESEADTLSPQPWETGDSLEGPHFNLHIGASVQPVYQETRSMIDSPISGNYFSGIRCSNY